MALQDNKKSALTIGELVVDWISTEKGQGFIESTNFIKSLGGNASNVAIGLSRLGTNSKVVAKVGDDIQGKYLLKVLDDEKVDTASVIVDKAHPTAQCYVFTTPDDDNTFLNWPSGNAAQKLCPSDITDDIISDTNGSELIHATGISLTSEPRRSAVIKALVKAKECGLTLSFDAGFPTGEGEEAKDSVKKAMEVSDIIKVNLLELIYWNRQIDPDHCTETIPPELTSLYDNPPSSGHESGQPNTIAKLADGVLKQLSKVLCDKYKPKVLVVTLAEQGSFIFSGEHQISIPAFKVKTVAGVGAGDAYIAGFLHYLTQNSKESKVTKYLEQISKADLKEAGLFASAVGALTTRSSSAHESLPYADEVKNLVKTQNCEHRA